MLYVVTSGDYSDYKIRAIYDRKELAEKLVLSLHLHETDLVRIEEWPLNPYAPQLQKGWKAYELGMEKNGDTAWIETSDEASLRYPGICDTNFPDNCQIMVAICFAKSKEHAIKIANERRVQLIANNKWGKEVTEY